MDQASGVPSWRIGQRACIHQASNLAGRRFRRRNPLRDLEIGVGPRCAPSRAPLPVLSSPERDAEPAPTRWSAARS